MNEDKALAGIYGGAGIAVGVVMIIMGAFHLYSLCP